MTDPPRLLETPDRGLATRLLRSASHDRPRPGALNRALSGAALLGTASIATTSVAAGLGKSLTPWLVTGLLGGVAASVSVHAAMPFFSPEVSPRSQPSGRQAEAASRTPRAQLSGPTRGAEVSGSPGPEPEPTPTARSPSGEASSGAEWTRRGVAPARSSAEPAMGPSGAMVVPRPPAVLAFEDAPTRPHEPGPFAAELVLIDAARQSLSEGRTTLALSTLAEHAREFPAGHFRPEALVLEIEAQALRGDSVTVRRLASRFLDAYPAHPLGTHVRELAATP
jgi:hypothetical protein